jgi:hypothetical protein
VASIVIVLPDIVTAFDVIGVALMGAPVIWSYPVALAENLTRPVGPAMHENANEVACPGFRIEQVGEGIPCQFEAVPVPPTTGFMMLMLVAFESPAFLTEKSRSIALPGQTTAGVAFAAVITSAALPTIMLNEVPDNAVFGLQNVAVSLGTKVIIPGVFTYMPITKVVEPPTGISTGFPPE